MAGDLSPADRRTKERVPALTEAARRLRRGRSRGPVTPHVGTGPARESTAVGGRSGALRAAIFGANDGLVSNASLIFGVAGAGAESRFVLIAGIAGLLAGACSMAAGEYISMRVQREVFERLIHLEAHELGADPASERAELAALYARKGVPADLADRVAEALMRDPARALDTHAREELGLDPEEGLGSPVAAATWSFLTFSVGALIPLAPFVFASGAGATIASAVLTGIALFGVGAAMSALTDRPWVRSGLRMLAIGSLAAAVTFAIGSLFGVATA
ncbi:MAG: VIT1/CCC1 transporter family protein [Actinomycetota bacterium]